MSDPPPERGFAAREAYKQEKRWTERARSRLRQRENERFVRKEGSVWGNQGFPHASAATVLT
jgi:hypothetical protein